MVVDGGAVSQTVTDVVCNVVVPVCAKEFVPDREDDTEVAVAMLHFDRVMELVHMRAKKNRPQPPRIGKRHV